MVLSGRARYAGMIASRTNTCGGNNKSGLPSRIGAVSNRRNFECGQTCYTLPKVCVITKPILMYYKPGRKYLG